MKLKRHDESLFLRLLAVLILLTIIPCAFFSYIVFKIERSRHMEQTATLLNSMAADRELMTRLIIDKRRDSLSFLAADPEIARLARDASKPGPVNSTALEQKLRRNPSFTGLAVIDAESGRYLAAGPFSKEMIQASAQQMKQRNEMTSVRMEALPDGERVLLIGQPLQRQERAGRSGFLLGMANIAIFKDLYKDTSMLGEAGESFITDSKGIAMTKLRYHSPDEQSHPIDASAMLDCLAGRSKAFVITPDYTGTMTAMSYRPVQGYGGCIMVHMRASEVMAPINKARNMILAIVASIVAAAALTAFMVARRLLGMAKERRRLEEDLERHAAQMEATVAERTSELKAEIKGRIDAELRLRESEAFLENIIHNVHEVIALAGVEGDGRRFRLVWWNANGEKMFGMKSAEASGRTFEEVFGPEAGRRLSSRYSDCVESGVVECEETVKTPRGQVVLLMTLVPVKDKNGRVVQIISSAIDITERKKLEAEMIRSQKLESLGLLAGGIAHDFNNLLAVIKLNISALKSGESLDQESLEMLELVDSSTLKATNLTNQLLTFSKGGKPVMKAFSVRELISGVINSSLGGTKTTCRLNIAKDLYDIEADPGQITQVLSNMLINAEQSMPEGGIVDLSAENVEITGVERGLPLKPGKYLKITIEDHGVGIPKENLPRIFDPYFTTRKKGSGLGLASSYSIVKNHNGHITVFSVVGSGTAFDIYLPALTSKTPVKAVEAVPFERGSGLVLVMDDDEVVLASVCKALKLLGYEASAASNGQEAVLKYKEGIESGMPFDAVILDLTIPLGMGGEEAAGKILELDRSARIFVSSGYSDSAVIANFEKHGFCGVLKKPYDAYELHRKLRASIMAKAGGVPE